MGQSSAWTVVLGRALLLGQELTDERRGGWGAHEVGRRRENQQEPMFSLTQIQMVAYRNTYTYAHGAVCTHASPRSAT